ncbi:hypothetical protein LDENG_00147400, partial [Lucifuga dentata]
MYTVPELYGTEDYLCEVPEQDIARYEDSLHRSDIACDEDVHTLCTYFMAENDLSVPKDAYMAINLYLSLREQLVTLLS